MEEAQHTWLPIAGFEGYYEVSNTGLVRSIPNPEKYRPNQGGVIYQALTKFGYKVSNLSRNNKSHYKRVHRLVAIAFIPNPENKPCVNHIDGNKLNNHVSNLEWCTHSENEYHSYKVLGKNVKGIKKTFCNGVNPKAKKLMCQTNGKTYSSVNDAAKDLGIHRGNINKQIKGEIKQTGGHKFKFV